VTVQVRSARRQGYVLTAQKVIEIIRHSPARRFVGRHTFPVLGIGIGIASTKESAVRE